MDEGNDFLMGGGVPSAQFKTIGAVCKGTIVSWEKTQQTDFDTNAPLVWDDGSPRWQVVITVQTDERDAEKPLDDGNRKLYVKGQMTVAVREAIKAAGETVMQRGATIAVQFHAEEPVKKGNPKKLYRAQYAPPAAVAGATDLLGGSAEPTAAAPAAPPEPAQAQPAAADLF